MHLAEFKKSVEKWIGGVHRRDWWAPPFCADNEPGADKKDGAAKEDKNFGIGGKTIDKVKAEYMRTHK